MTRLWRLTVVASALVLAAFASALLLPSPVHALPVPINLVRYDIEAHGRVNELIVQDLDGDGLKDLVLVMGREVRIFFQTAHGFPSEPDQDFRIDPRATIFDFGDVDGNGRKSLCILREDGVYAYPLMQPRKDGEKPYYELRAKKLLSAAPILRRPSEDEIRRKEFLRDVDGDGKLDAIVPERGGFGIYRGLGGGKFAERQALPAPPTSVVNVGSDHLHSQLVASYFFANPTIADFDACGRPEIVLAQDDWLSVFHTSPEGRLAPFPATRVQIPGQRAFTLDAEKPFELDFTMPLILKDLNHDGRLDAALTHVGSGTTKVFINGPNPMEAFKTPARIVRAKGVTLIAFFVDLDGRKLEDMILPRMDKVGIWSILKAVVTRSVPVEAQFFYQGKSGPIYGEEPDFTKSFDVPISIHSKGDGLDFGTSIIASLDGDFDGDGLKDLLYRTDATKLSIFPGLADGKGIADSASAELEIISTDDYRFVLPEVTDLNNDGRSDIVLRYFSWDRREDRVSVFLSR